jgi:hypothetical protein
MQRHGSYDTLLHSDNGITEVLKMDVSLWKQYFNPLIRKGFYYWLGLKELGFISHINLIQHRF